MSKFTKGTWLAIDGDRFSREMIITSDERIECEVIPICELDVYFDGEIGDEQKANANLIAAAPEMYKFLNDIAKGNGVDYQIEQLLAKARGEK